MMNFYVNMKKMKVEMKNISCMKYNEKKYLKKVYVSCIYLIPKNLSCVESYVDKNEQKISIFVLYV